MKRKIFYGVWCCIGSALLAVSLFYLWLRPVNETSLRIGYNIGSVTHAPIMVAHDAGIFDKHKLKVELVPLKSGQEIQQALALGMIDIGSAGATNFFIPISKGAPIKIIAPSSSSPTQVFVRPDNKIKTINDLVGKAIASKLGESSNLALGYALSKDNISFSSIKIVDIEKTLRPIALMEKKIVDAAVAGEYEKKIYLDHGAVIFEEWKTKGYTNKSFPRTVIAVSSDFMAKNKKTVKLFIDAFIESQKYIKDHPDEAARIVAKHIETGSEGVIKFSTDDIKEAWQETKYVLWYEPSDLVEISKIEKEMGIIDSVLTLDQIFDLSFEKKLKDAQNEIYPIN